MDIDKTSIIVDFTQTLNTAFRPLYYFNDDENDMLAVRPNKRTPALLSFVDRLNFEVESARKHIEFVLPDTNIDWPEQREFNRGLWINWLIFSNDLLIDCNQEIDESGFDILIELLEDEYRTMAESRNSLESEDGIRANHLYDMHMPVMESIEVRRGLLEIYIRQPES